MAKRIVDEEMRFSIVVNGNPAQKELHKLEGSTRKLTSTNKLLRAERDRLRAQGKQNTAEYKKLSASIKQNNATIKSNKARMKELQGQIGITGLTMAQLQKRASILRLQLRNMVPGSAQYKKLQADLTATNSRIKQLATQANAAKLSLGSLADGFNRYAAMGAAVIATGTGLALTFSKLIDFQGELSDAQGDVMKTTGLTKDEVDELTKSLGDLNTRTSRMELLALATEAGRLGIEGVNNVKAFVETANLLKVALGDELSDEAIREVGKMANIFKVGDQTGRDFGESMQSLGSAINHVSASGANTADFLVDFMKRTAGVAGLADISADKVIGIAAAFDELGQGREISATAMNKTLISMGENVEKFANAAGVSTQKLSKTLKEDANEALMLFLEGIGRGNLSLEVMAQRLDGIEVGGTRGVQAMAALSQNLDLVRKRQDDANEALFENTSLMDEYNIKNENTAALLAKIRRRVMGIFASNSITNGIETFLNYFAKFIGATVDAEGSVTRFRDRLVMFFKILAVLLVSVVSYNAAIRLTGLLTKSLALAQTILNAVQNRGVILNGLLKGSVLLLKAGYYGLTGNITRATAAMRLFNAVTKNNPLGILLSVLTGVGAAYLIFKKNAESASKAQEKINNIKQETAKSLLEEKTKIDLLLKVAKDETQSKKDRLKAIKKLNSISPKYLGNLDLENIKTDEATKSINKYLKAVEKKAKAQAIENKQAEAYKQLIEKNLKAQEDYQKQIDALPDKMARRKQGQSSVLSGGGFSAPQIDVQAQTDRLTKGYKRIYSNAINANMEEFSVFQEKLKKAFGDAQMDLFEDENENSANGVNATKTPSSFTLENLIREREAIAKLRKENYDLEVNQIDDAFWREMMLLESNHEEKMRRLRAQKIEEAEIAKTQGLLDQAISEDVNGSNQEAIDNYTRVLEIWEKKNAEVDERIRLEKVAHQEELGDLVKEGIDMDIKLMEQAFIKERQEREIHRKQQLADVAHSERRTQQLKEQFKKEDLERERQHVLDIREMVNGIIDSGKFEDFDLELLTQEQKDQIVARLQELGLEIADINLLLSKMQNGGKSTDALGDLGLGGDVDILGFSPDQWEYMFSNFNTFEEKLAGIVMGVKAMTNAYAMFSDFQNKKEQERIKALEQNNQREKESLQRKLNAGYINERQHADAVENLEKKLDEEKEKIAKKQAKREKQLALARIATNTAVAIMGIWADFPKVDFGATAAVMSGVVSALGAAQAAMVLSTKGYQYGLYPDKLPIQREQDGKMFNASFGGQSRSGMVDEPTLFLAGEQGKSAPEMIISGGDWAQMNPEVKNSLSRELGRVRGFENGMYPEENQGSSEVDTMLLMALEKNSMLLDKLIKEGVLAKVIANESNARQLQEALDKFKKRKESSKI